MYEHTTFSHHPTPKENLSTASELQSSNGECRQDGFPKPFKNAPFGVHHVEVLPFCVIWYQVTLFWWTIILVTAK